MRLAYGMLYIWVQKTYSGNFMRQLRNRRTCHTHTVGMFCYIAHVDISIKRLNRRADSADILLYLSNIL